VGGAKSLGSNGFHSEIRFGHAPTAIEAVRWISELRGNAEQLGNESGLRDSILLRHPSRSALPNPITASIPCNLRQAVNSEP
jgi:hypothetical protein